MSRLDRTGVATRRRGGVQERHVSVMGGNAHLIVVDASAGAVDRGVRRLQELEARWSRFRPDSEISRLNARPGVPTTVSADTFHLVGSAVRWWQATEGAFDPTVYDAVVALGYDRTFSQVRAAYPHADVEPAPPQTAPAPGCGAIRCDPATLTVTLPDGCRFDAGGLGKGLAADLVTEQLMEDGAAGACVNVGGDLRVRGISGDGGAWTVGIDDPHRPGDRLTCLQLVDAALATSSPLLRRWGRGRHHLIDPASGLPVRNDLDSVSVAAPDASAAEALAKAAFVREPAVIGPLIDSAGAAALFVHRDGSVSATAAWPSLAAQPPDHPASTGPTGASQDFLVPKPGPGARSQ